MVAWIERQRHLGAQVVCHIVHRLDGTLTTLSPRITLHDHRSHWAD
jgi:hypothetical protein